MTSSMSIPGLSDLWRAITRHKKKSFATVLLMVIIAAAAAIFVPKSYHSEGMLLVRLGKENTTLDPTVAMGQEPVVTVPASRDSELNSVVEILKSRAIAEKVVDLLGADFILRPSKAVSGAWTRRAGSSRSLERLGQAWARSKEFLRRLEGTTEPGDRDRAVHGTHLALQRSSARKSDLIQIECKGPSPQWSQKIVAALMEVYQSEHIRLNRPHRSVEFFTEQTGRAHNELVAKQEALRDLKTASGIFSPSDQRQTFAAPSQPAGRGTTADPGRRKGVGNPRRDLAPAVEFIARRASGVGHYRLRQRGNRPDAVGVVSTGDSQGRGRGQVHRCPSGEAGHRRTSAGQPCRGEQPGADADPYCQGARTRFTRKPKPRCCRSRPCWPASQAKDGVLTGSWPPRAVK